jgi:Rnl2 family RNA ligase
MATFKKWHSIENSYRQETIDYYLRQCPELPDEQYTITEKLHGSNFQIYFQPNEPVRVGSRRNFLNADDHFRGAYIPRLLESHGALLERLQGYVDSHDETIRLFGELFGEGIQKGVKYGPPKRIRYFGLMLDDILEPFSCFRDWIEDDDLIVPIVAEVSGLEAALAFNTEFDSMILNEPDNICEGIVIQPLDRVYTDGHGSPFILKKKNERFAEKQREKKPIVVDTEVARLNEEFKAYITENRLQGVFSKQGEIQRPDQIGDYIRLMLADAKEDFIKDFDNGFSALDGKQQKQVLNVGAMIAHMLKGYL